MYPNHNPYYSYPIPFNPSYPYIPYGISNPSNQFSFPPMNQPPPPLGSENLIPSSVYIPTAPQEFIVQPKLSSENSSENSSDQKLPPETTSNQQSTLPPNPNLFINYPYPYQNYR